MNKRTEELINYWQAHCLADLSTNWPLTCWPI